MSILDDTDAAIQTALNLIEDFGLDDFRYSITVSPIQHGGDIRVLFHDAYMEEIGANMAWDQWRKSNFGKADFIELDGTRVSFVAEMAPQPEPEPDLPDGCCGQGCNTTHWELKS